MTKNKHVYFSVIFVFIIAPFMMGNDIKSKIIGQSWYMPDEIAAFINFSEKTYDISFEIGGYYCSGDYIISGDEVVLYYPKIMPPFSVTGSTTLNWIFKNDNHAVFIYDPEYVDFDCISSLGNNDSLLKNLSRPSPYGQMYKIQDIDVIKYNYQESMVLILDNLRMREHPDINSPVTSLDIYLPSTGDSFSGYIVHKNSINSFDAKTVKQDTIDGITAPWYRISIILNEVFQKNVWVFGGYLREIDAQELNNQETMRNYWKRYYDTLVDIGIIKRNPFL